MGDSEPVLQRPYPITIKHYDWVRSEINKLLDAQVICNSHSSWSVPIIVIPKGDGGKCLVIEYRALNKVTWKLVCHMPRVEGIFSKLNGVKYFSILDLSAWYDHIHLDEDYILQTAFTSPFWKYEYLQVPFGLAQALAYFQELMNKVLPFAIALFRWHYYIEENCKRTPEQSTASFPQTLHCRINYEIEPIWLFGQGNPIFGSCPQHYWPETTTFQDSSY